MSKTPVSIEFKVHDQIEATNRHMICIGSGCRHRAKMIVTMTVGESNLFAPLCNTCKKKMYLNASPVSSEKAKVSSKKTSSKKVPGPKKSGKATGTAKT